MAFGAPTIPVGTPTFEGYPLMPVGGNGQFAPAVWAPGGLFPGKWVAAVGAQAYRDWMADPRNWSSAAQGAGPLLTTPTMPVQEATTPTVGRGGPHSFANPSALMMPAGAAAPGRSASGLAPLQVALASLAARFNGGAP